MAENDGSVVLGLSLDIKELKKGTDDVQAELKKLTTTFREQGEKAGKTYVEGASKGIVNLNQRLNNFVASMKDISPKMGQIGEKIASQFSKPLLSAIPKISAAFSAMLPIIGLVAGAVALAGKAVGAIVKAHKEFSDNTGKADTAQILLSGSVSKATKAMTLQKAIVKELNEEYGKSAGVRERLGEELSKLYRDVLDKMGLVSAAEFDALNAEYQYTRNKQKLGKVNDEVTKSFTRTARAIKNIEAAEGAELITAEEAAKQKLASTEAHIQTLLELRTVLEALAGEHSIEVQLINEQIAAQQRTREGMALTVKAYELLNDARNAEAGYKEQLEQIAVLEKAGAVTARKAVDEKIGAVESYIRVLAAQAQAISKKEGASSREAKAARAALRAQVDYLNTLKEQAELMDAQDKKGKTGKKENEEDPDVKRRKEIMEAYHSALLKADAAKKTAIKGGMDLAVAEEERMKAVDSAARSAHTELIALGEEFNYASQYTPRWNEAIEEVSRNIQSMEKPAREIDEIFRDQKYTLDEQALAQELVTGGIKTELDYNIKLIELERTRGKEELKKRLERIKASEDEKNKALANFDKITEGMIEAEKAGGEADKSLNSFFSSEKWQAGMQLATAAVQTFTDIASAITQAQAQAVEEQVAEIDKMLDEELERIEEMRQKALEEAGFAEAATQESLQAKMDAAKEAGDQILAYEYQRRMEEKAINDRFDAQAEAAEKEAKMKKGQLEYEAAIAEWETSKVTGTINGALAVLQALSSANFPLNFVIAGLVGAAAVVQQGIIADNPPRRPSFESGGIVPGASFSGDNVLARVNSGERILTMDQQEFMLEAAGAGVENQTITVVVPVYLDGEKITEVVADNINSARVLLEKRGIKGL
jgi:hypothetical protein